MVESASGLHRPSCGILRINLSHDLPHSLGQACRGGINTTAGRLIFKPENGKTKT